MRCADPGLTHGLPPYLTAATGMDALTHCVETYLSPLVNPPAEAIALDGVQRAAAWIEEADRNGAEPRGALEHDDGVDGGCADLPEGPRRRPRAWPIRSARSTVSRSTTGP